MGDDIVPWTTPSHRPNYEYALVTGLRRVVEEEDHVVIIGGGYGITAVAAANQVGPNGVVTIYEASEETIKILHETLRLNSVSDRCNIHHAIVGEEIDVFGSAGDASTVLPSDLPDCDVLEMDCEGAELGILEGLDVRPTTMLVETHGMLSAPTEEVTNLLLNLGYDTDIIGADRSTNDVMVVEAALKGHCLAREFEK